LALNIKAAAKDNNLFCAGVEIATNYGLFGHARLHS